MKGETVDQGLIVAQLESAAAGRVYPHGAAWGRALGWWRRAAEIAPALPLGLAADLGALLAGEGTLASSVAPQAATGDA
ncbi:MAG: hypothetical protein HGA65_14130, partial [Oscillochloris sp.]|nr:hypothetical protein [Oscillochloris sp.]